PLALRSPTLQSGLRILSLPRRKPYPLQGEPTICLPFPSATGVPSRLKGRACHDRKANEGGSDGEAGAELALVSAARRGSGDGARGRGRRLGRPPVRRLAEPDLRPFRRTVSRGCCDCA